MTTANAANPTAASADRDLRGTKVGVVTSDKRNKTRTVQVEFQVRHPKYGKFLKRNTRFHVHDEKNESKLGDRVEIANCRPISKSKSWRLVRVIQRSQGQIEHKTEV